MATCKEINQEIEEESPTPSDNLDEASEILESGLLLVHVDEERLNLQRKIEVLQLKIDANEKQHQKIVQEHDREMKQKDEHLLMNVQQMYELKMLVDEAQKQTDELSKEKDKLVSIKKRLEIDAENHRDEIRKLRDELSSCEADLTAANKKIEEQKRQIKKLESENLEMFQDYKTEMSKYTRRMEDVLTTKIDSVCKSHQNELEQCKKEREEQSREFREIMEKQRDYIEKMMQHDLQRSNQEPKRPVAPTETRSAQVVKQRQYFIPINHSKKKPGPKNARY